MLLCTYWARGWVAYRFAPELTRPPKDWVRGCSFRTFLRRPHQFGHPDRSKRKTGWDCQFCVFCEEQGVDEGEQYALASMRGISVATFTFPSVSLCEVMTCYRGKLPGKKGSNCRGEKQNIKRSLAKFGDQSRSGLKPLKNASLWGE